MTTTTKAPAKKRTKLKSRATENVLFVSWHCPGSPDERMRASTWVDLPFLALSCHPCLLLQRTSLRPQRSRARPTLRSLRTRACPAERA